MDSPRAAEDKELISAVTSQTPSLCNDNSFDDIPFSVLDPAFGTRCAPLPELDLAKILPELFLMHESTFYNVCRVVLCHTWQLREGEFLQADCIKDEDKQQYDIVFGVQGTVKDRSEEKSESYCVTTCYSPSRGIQLSEYIDKAGCENICNRMKSELWPEMQGIPSRKCEMFISIPVEYLANSGASVLESMWRSWCSEREVKK